MFGSFLFGRLRGERRTRGCRDWVSRFVIPVVRCLRKDYEWELDLSFGLERSRHLDLYGTWVVCGEIFGGAFSDRFFDMSMFAGWVAGEGLVTSTSTACLGLG